MSYTAILLVTIASFTHVAWNLAGKRRNPSVAFFFVACACGAGMLMPWVAWNYRLLPLVPNSVWAMLILTGFWQALYFSGLACAYAHGHLSVAYPLARALPVLLVALISTLRHGAGHPVAWTGMALIVAGAMLLPVPAFRQWHWRNYQNRSCFFALVAAVGTAGYSITDDAALSDFRFAAADHASVLRVTLVYAAFEGAATCMWLLPVVLRHHAGRANLRLIVTTQRNTAVLAGLGIFVTYSLVLLAMAFVRDVSYVVAFRQLSIPLGTMVGIVVLGEPACTPKIIGVALMFVGLVLAAIY